MKAKSKIEYHIERFSKLKTRFESFHLARITAALDMIKSEMDSKNRQLRILDVGCNDGTISKLILDLGNDVYGIDVVPILVKRAKQKGIKAKMADCTRGLPFKDNFFDVVHAAEVIEHIFDTEFFLSETRRVLRKDGVIIITTPNIASLTSRIRLVLGLYPKFVAPALKDWLHGGHIRVFTKNVLEELLRREGFKIERTVANLVSIIPAQRTVEPWSIFLGKIFPSLGEILIIKARRK